MSLLASVVDEAAGRFGDRPAFLAEDGAELTYGELASGSRSVGISLAEVYGIRSGDVVALAMPSSPEYVLAYVAAARLGAVTAGVNPRLSLPQQQELLEVAGPDVVLRDPAEVVELLRRRPHAGGHPPASAPTDPDRPVAIVFTSGTTGPPKGAVFTDRQLEAIRRIDLGSDQGRWGAGGHMLASTELVHVGFMTKLPWYLQRGTTIHLLEKWRAADALQVVADHGITTVGGISSQIALMLREPDFDRYDLSHVERIVAGGGPSAPALVREARRRFGADYSIRYSSTESGGVGTATAFDAPDEEALHTVGRPRPGVEVRILDEQVQLRSDAVMAGYWHDGQVGQDPETTRTLVDGWLVTGDRGVIDDAGCLRLLGRASDGYVRGGYNVHPQTVVAALLDDPTVGDAAVVARPDPVMGHVGVAVVVPARADEPPSLEALRERAARRLARHELPEDLVIVERIPRTSLHKLDRDALEAIVRQTA